MKKNLDTVKVEVNTNESLEQEQELEQEKELELTEEEKKEIRKHRIVIGILIGLCVVVLILFFAGVRFYVPEGVAQFYYSTKGPLKTVMTWFVKASNFVGKILQ